MALERHVTQHAELHQQEGELGSKEDLLKHAAAGVDFFAIDGQQVVPIHYMTHRKEHEACHRNQWNCH